MARVLRSLPKRFVLLQHASSTASSPYPWKHFLHTTTVCSQQLETASSTAVTAPPPYSSEDIPSDPYFVELGRLPSDKVIRIADEMLSLSVLEVSDVADLLKKKLKISHMPVLGFGMGGAMAGGAAAGQAAEEKKPAKTTFEVKLEKYDAASKIKIIKEIRVFTTLGLKEAKELVEKTPAVLKTGISKEEAMDIVEKLKAVGATVVME